VALHAVAHRLSAAIRRIAQERGAACVTFLQNWLILFYPYRLDLVRLAEEMIIELGRGTESTAFARELFLDQCSLWPASIQAFSADFFLSNGYFDRIP